MFSRSSRTRKVVVKPATVKVIKPEQEQEVLDLSKEKICFSKMTFPHQLIRVFLLEQIFRAFKISNGETYHR